MTKRPPRPSFILPNLVDLLDVQVFLGLWQPPRWSKRRIEARRRRIAREIGWSGPLPKLKVTYRVNPPKKERRP